MKDKKTLADYSLEELDKAYMCLPKGNPNKELFAAEIERRMESDKKSDTVEKALDYLIQL